MIGRRTAIAATLILAAPATLAAQAGANLVVAGGFTSPVLGSSVLNVFFGPDAPGLYLVSQPVGLAGPTYTPGGAVTAKQTLATTAGTTYEVSFGLSFAGMGVGATRVEGLFGTTTLLNVVTSKLSFLFLPVPQVQTYRFLVTAPTSDTELAFRTQLVGSCSGLGCDNFNSVTYLSKISVSAVPEPATLALTAGGLLVLGAAARRKASR